MDRETARQHEASQELTMDVALQGTQEYRHNVPALPKAF